MFIVIWHWGGKTIDMESYQTKEEVLENILGDEKVKKILHMNHDGGTSELEVTLKDGYNLELTPKEV